jgi:hypothetical protein
MFSETGPDRRRADNPGGGPGTAKLFRLIYVSRATAPTGALRQLALRDIAEASLRNNARRGVTGALALVGCWFAQVLEGPRDALEEAWDRILADTRHADVRLLSFAPASARAFGGWALATPEAMTEGVVLMAADAHEEGDVGGMSGMAGVLVNAMARRLPLAA